MSSVEVLKVTLSNTKFWSTIIVSAFVILLGYFLEKRRWLANGWGPIVTKINLLIALPALILKGFMVDLTVKQFNNMLILIIIGILAYILLTLLSRFVFTNYRANTRDALMMCAVCPSVLFFGYPMAIALIPSGENYNSLLDTLNQATNLFNIAFWFFLSWYSLYIYQRPEFDPNLTKKDRRLESWNILKGILKNPIMLALIIGIILWLMQMIPGIRFIHVTNNGWNTIAPGHYSITRLDALIPGFQQAVSMLGALSTPLSWFSIGVVLTRSPFWETFKNKVAWYSSLYKMFAVPAVSLGLFVFFAWFGKVTHLYQISSIALLVSVMMMASPTATAMNSYSTRYEKAVGLSAQICTQTTITAAVSMPVWAVLTSLVGNTSLFVNHF